MTEEQPQPEPNQQKLAQVIDLEREAQEPSKESVVIEDGQENSSSASNNYNEIWASMTQQQNASLQALQQTMQLNELNTSNNTNQSGESDDSSTSQPQQRQKKLPRQPKTAENKEEKPPVGSEEWHKQRRENHKQVERRRRETINDGINEIARIVPGCEKNKGSILQRAAVYIRQLKENETATMEKWTLEKLLTDQAMSELNRQVELLKVELDRARMENNYLKRELENATGPDSKKHKKE